MLSNKEAFLLFRIFLDDYYLQTSSFDIGSLLGDTTLLVDETTADPAAWNDWQESLNNTLVGNLTIGMAYKAAIDFLEKYSKRINSEEVTKLVQDMRIGENQNNRYWMQWRKAAEIFSRRESDVE